MAVWWVQYCTKWRVLNILPQKYTGRCQLLLATRRFKAGGITQSVDWVSAVPMMGRLGISDVINWEKNYVWCERSERAHYYGMVRTINVHSCFWVKHRCNMVTSSVPFFGAVTESGEWIQRKKLDQIHQQFCAMCCDVLWNTIQSYCMVNSKDTINFFPG